MTAGVQLNPDNILQYPEVWKEMLDYHRFVLINHCGDVQTCLGIFITHPDYAHLKQQLNERYLTHDSSKFEADEFHPYVWRYWRTKWAKEGKVDTRFTEAFASLDVDRYITKAVWHHVQHNRHHPEYHLDHDDMTLVDLIEMVCDWYAMSEELDTNIDDWVAYVVPRRYHFSADKVATIHQLIEILRQKKREYEIISAQIFQKVQALKQKDLESGQ
jgi:hypothetical protein